MCKIYPKIGCVMMTCNNNPWDYGCILHAVILSAVLRPSIEYGSGIWKCNKHQVATLELIIWKGSQKNSDCHLKCNEAGRGDRA